MTRTTISIWTVLMAFAAWELDPAPAGAEEPVKVFHRTVKVGDLDVFYREAGPADAPAIVLLHGFPTSSNMFRNLIPALADRYHVIAPDYPGFGHSDMPDRAKFEYSFAHFAAITDTLLTRLNVQRYALYVMDYGAPVGYRLAIQHPERVTALVIQNGNAYEEGLEEFWKPIRAYWASGQPAQRNALREGTTLAATRSQYLGGVADTTRVDPSAWVLDQALLDRPGNVLGLHLEPAVDVVDDRGAVFPPPLYLVSVARRP